MYICVYYNQKNLIYRVTRYTPLVNGRYLQFGDINSLGWELIGIYPMTSYTSKIRLKHKISRYKTGFVKKLVNLLGEGELLEKERPNKFPWWKLH